MPASIDPFSTATELLNALRDKQVSAVELTDLYRGRFERHNPTLNAIVDHDYDGARISAAKADAARASGDERPLLGLPITIKDTINVRGFRSTAGVLEWAEQRPEADAVAVARLRAAGAIIMGKTNVPPYAADWQADNPVSGGRNPWDLDAAWRVQRRLGGGAGGRPDCPGTRQRHRRLRARAGCLLRRLRSQVERDSPATQRRIARSAASESW